MNVERLVRRKGRLTDALRVSEMVAFNSHRPPPKATLLRARLYRVDLLLERAGVLPKP